MDKKTAIIIFAWVLFDVLIGLALYELYTLNIPYWLTNVTIYNETPVVTTYQITVSKGGIVYAIRIIFTNITGNLQCKLTPDPPISGPAVVWLTCPTGHVEEIDIITNKGTAQYTNTEIGQASETITYQT
jgi:hypothetical protein